MKKSIFNIFQKIDGNKDIVFQNFYKIYNNLDNLDINSLNENEKEIFNGMVKCNFIIDNDDDEIKNLEYLRIKSNTDPNLFSLVIYPTLSCNFDCYYCYEKNRAGVMSKEIQEKIIEFVEFHAEKKKDIKLTWFGGEPLLAINIIYYLSEKIKDICIKNKVKYFSHIISNGYLFTDEIILKLKNII